MARSRSTALPFDAATYDFDGARLRQHWDRLHEGDREPFPDARSVALLLDAIADSRARRAHPDPQRLARDLQQAWRLYHQGAFEQAANLAADLGPLGAVAAAKAVAIQATHVERAHAARLRLFRRAASLAADAAGLMPAHANLHYLQAYALGRQAQAVAIVEALAQGIGSRVRQAVERALELEPKHADAHALLGTWHAEIIGKVGALLGGVTYGASRADAMRRFRRSLQLAPRAAVARTEYAAGLLLMFGDARRDEARRLLLEASRITPADAMEHLELERARQQLARL
jgi:hypothetical protein